MDGSAGREARALPFLKWAGGKRSIAPRLAELFPADASQRTYREPFLGGGAMFFHLRPKRAFLSDALADLVGAYRIVQREVERLIEKLRALEAGHDRAQYYAVRARYNAERDADPVDRAAWLIYLNRTGYNGLFRTNKLGMFNVPLGRFDKPRVVHPERLRGAAAGLAGAEIRHASFEHLLDEAEPGDFVYLDPPYVPLSKTASFSAYAGGDFALERHEELARVFRALDERGCLLALSNSDTPLVRKLYRGYAVTSVEVPRPISSRAETRGAAPEVLIRNLARYPRRARTTRRA